MRPMSASSRGGQISPGRKAPELPRSSPAGRLQRHESTRRTSVARATPMATFQAFRRDSVSPIAEGLRTRQDRPIAYAESHRPPTSNPLLVRYEGSSLAIDMSS